MPYKDAEQARDYQREYRRVARAGGDVQGVVRQVPLPFRLKTAADVMALLEEQVQAVREDKEAATLEKARTVGFLAGVALRAIEAGEMAVRVEALEGVLKQREAV